MWSTFMYVSCVFEKNAYSLIVGYSVLYINTFIISRLLTRLFKYAIAFLIFYRF